jgi:metallo-beta-lactamase family protein
MAELEFFGAAQTVTGSMHLLHVNGDTFALDCGLFQGRREESRLRNMTFPIAARELKGVLLSHAHMDHSGNIPGLVRDKFSAPVWATDATCDLTQILLADSAKIQEEDARYWNQKRAKRPQDFIKPLYTMQEAKASTQFFQQVQYDKTIEFSPGCRATWIEAGHILGSASILIELDRPKARLLYTGDLGRFNTPILRDPEYPPPPPPVDYLITECTYADRRHANQDDMKDKLIRIIKQTRDIGGKVIVPSFSVGRTQEIVYYLSQAYSAGLLEPLPIYVDSPLSTSATEVFKRHPECYDIEATAFLKSHADLFGSGLVTYVTDVSQSKSLNDKKEPCVIIASSGMCEAGRILHHLKNNVECENNTIVIVGFQAQHTLGRRIVERREEIRIFGRMYKLLARIEVLNGLSAHADCDEFASVYQTIAPKLKAAFCVHGEGPQPLAMKEILTKAGCKNVHIPAPGDRFEL